MFGTRKFLSEMEGGPKPHSASPSRPRGTRRLSSSRRSSSEARSCRAPPLRWRSSSEHARPHPPYLTLTALVLICCSRRLKVTSDALTSNRQRTASPSPASSPMHLLPDTTGAVSPPQAYLIHFAVYIFCPRILEKEDDLDEYPLFNSVYQIAFCGAPPQSMIAAVACYGSTSDICDVGDL